MVEPRSEDRRCRYSSSQDIFPSEALLSFHILDLNEAERSILKKIGGPDAQISMFSKCGPFLLSSPFTGLRFWDLGLPSILCLPNSHGCISIPRIHVSETKLCQSILWENQFVLFFFSPVGSLKRLPAGGGIPRSRWCDNTVRGTRPCRRIPRIILLV